MRIADLNWMQVEAYPQHDDRVVVPFYPLPDTKTLVLWSAAVDDSR
jgi:hypothetical protein